MRSRRAVPAALLLVAVTAVSASEAWLESRHPSHRTASSLLYLPNGRFLEIASLGHSTFLADLIYLWSIQYYSGFGGEERLQVLEHVYGNVIARLDPRFVEPYLVGALIMVAEKGDVEGALRLLDLGMGANPDAWILPYEAGFWAYDHARDYIRAARYFEMAMVNPDAPPSARRLHAEMFNRRGDKATSLSLWQDVYRGAEDDKVRAVAANHVHDLTIDVDLQRLGAAVEAYRERHGRRPRHLDALVVDGLIDAVPADPDGNAYRYDPATGLIESTTPFRLRRR